MLLLLGLLLLGATGTFIGLVIAYNSAGSPDYTITMFGHALATLNSLQVFLAGAALTYVVILALAITAAGARRSRRHRAAHRAVLREANKARAERDALAARLGDDKDLTQVLTAAKPDTSDTSDTSSSGTRTATKSKSTTTTTASTTTPARKRVRMPHVFGH